MLGQSASTDPVVAFMAELASMRSRIADLERTTGRVTALDSRYMSSVTPLPRVRLANGAINALANATYGFVSFPVANEFYDAANLHDAANLTRVVTVPAGKAGLWRVGYTVDFVAFGGGIRQASVVVNNSTATHYGLQSISHTTATLGATLSGSDDVVLAVGDYVEVAAYQTSGGAMNIGAATTVARASYVGP